MPFEQSVRVLQDNDDSFCVVAAWQNTRAGHVKSELSLMSEICEN